MKTYLLFQGGAAWVGFHYSTDTKRLCINFVPFLTLCFVREGGQVPRQIRDREKQTPMFVLHTNSETCPVHGARCGPIKTQEIQNGNQDHLTNDL